MPKLLKSPWYLALACLLSSQAVAQALPTIVEQALVIAKFESADITIDGELDEAIWESISGFDQMSVVDPDTLQAASHQTLSRFFYTDRGLYIGIWAEQPPETLIPRLSSRDKEINRDGVTVYLDASGDGLYGFFFGVNLGGSLVDGSMLPERQFSNLWDGPWSGSSVATDTGYTVEMFLPWSMMAMPQSDDLRRTMGVSIRRRVAYLDETWGWPALPESKLRFMSGLQKIEFERINSGGQFAIYPFTAATQNRIRSQTSYRVGADVFWRPSSNMQLTATLNPDFGAVESDDVIVNLTAFETFFPEKRLFFLEGNEIFVTSPRAAGRGAASSTGARSVPNTFSLEPTTLLNTRRIGGSPRTPSIPGGVTIPDYELSQPTELAGAAKITGQQGKLRYGFMAAAEENTKFFGADENENEVSVEQSGRDFGILRLLYEDSNNGRRSIGWMSTLASHPEVDAFAHGIDLHYINGSSRVVADGQLINSDIEGSKGYGGFFDVNYIPRQGTSHRFSFDYLDDTLDINDLGFLHRNDVITYRYSFNKQTSQSDRFRFRNDGITVSHETTTDGRLINSSFYYRNTLTFNDRNQLNTTTIYRPERWDDRTSEGHADFKVHTGGLFEIAYGTDTSKKISSSIAVNTMSETLGDWSYLFKGGVTYKPNDRFSLDVDFMYRRANEWLIHLAGPTVGTYVAVHWQPGVGMDLFFTARQQLRFSLQWVGIKANATNLYRVPQGDGELIQITDGIHNDPTYDFTISRITAQLRYRWEIAPLSDLFIVYTRGSNIPSQNADGFTDLFTNALTDPIIDRLVIKLRYRFGS